MAKPITLVITEADARHRLETWQLSRWNLVNVPESSPTLWIECLTSKVLHADLGRLWEAFTPETMDVWKTKDKGTGEIFMIVEIGWMPVPVDEDLSSDTPTQIH